MMKRRHRRAALQMVLLSVALNSVGQVLFKAAYASQAHASFAHFLLSPLTWAGLIMYGLSAVCWLWVLARTHLSYAYPILSLTFPIVLGLSALFFADVISPMRWAGVAVIVVGVSLLART